MSERSKELDSSSSIFVCVGSNPTECNESGVLFIVGVWQCCYSAPDVGVGSYYYYLSFPKLDNFVMGILQRCYESPIQFARSRMTELSLPVGIEGRVELIVSLVVNWLALKAE